jgi:O-antigen/teichoic acid export membrane protein
MSLRRNVIANYLGQAWAALMGLAFIPIYIRYLGIEAYGLMGLFALLQAWLALLDVGLTPTLGREMARFTAGQQSPQAIRDLLRTLEYVCIGMATLIAIAVWTSSGWLASDWLKVGKLPIDAVQRAISIMALLVALRFVEGIYKSALFGLQRQVWTNGVNAALATLRGGGAVLILAAISPTIEAFFLWQALISLLSVLFLGFGVHRTLPHGSRRAQFSLTTLRPVWRYAGGMTGITLLALLLTQVDKLLLSRLLSLQDFGYYSLASMVAGVLYLLITPITTAMFPRMVELVSVSDNASLADIYHRGAQLVSVITAPMAVLLAFHGEGVLFAWSGSVDLATAAGPILAALAIGTFINGLMHMPYQLQLAHGWTGLVLKTNLVAVTLLVPTIFWVVPRHGAIGAAWVWIALNAGYVLLNIGLMHRRILTTEKWRWYGHDLLMPILGAAVTLLLLTGLKPSHLSDRIAWVAYLGIAFVAAIISATLTIRDYRLLILLGIRRAAAAKTI